MQLCVTLQGDSLESIQKQFEQARIENPDLIEWRLDGLSEELWPELRKLVESSSLPSILTLRTEKHGGKAKSQENSLEALCGWEVSYLDVEVEERHQLPFLRQRLGRTKVILSRHTQEWVDPEEEEKMWGAYKPDLLKLAIGGGTALQALQLVNWLKERERLLPYLCFMMGERGELSRLLGGVAKLPWMYSTVTHPKASGQLTLSQMKSLYRSDQVHAHTPLYVLLGDPVRQSVGHFAHNFLLQHLNQEGMYLKIEASQEEFHLILTELERLGVKGASVTMPHKEALGGCVNTLTWEGEWLQENTDGKGAVAALSLQIPQLQDKHVVIIGTGATARGIGAALMEEGARVWIGGRNPLRCQELAHQLGCEVWSEQECLSSFWVVHSTPCGMKGQPSFPQVPLSLLERAEGLLDCVVSLEPTPLMRKVQSQGAKTIGGRELFLWQAAYQSQRWYGAESTLSVLKEGLRRGVEAHVEKMSEEKVHALCDPAQ